MFLDIILFFECVQCKIDKVSSVHPPVQIWHCNKCLPMADLWACIHARMLEILCTYVSKGGMLGNSNLQALNSMPSVVILKTLNHHIVLSGKDTILPKGGESVSRPKYRSKQNTNAKWQFCVKTISFYHQSTGVSHKIFPAKFNFSIRICCYILFYFLIFIIYFLQTVILNFIVVAVSPHFGQLIFWPSSGDLLRRDGSVGSCNCIPINCCLL